MIEGLRLIGTKLDAGLVIDQFEDDVRELCDRYGICLTDVGEIEYLPDSVELVFTLYKTDGKGYIPLDCKGGPDCSHERCGPAAEVRKVSARDAWANWPKWWIPFNGGLFVDHALVDVNTSA